MNNNNKKKKKGSRNARAATPQTTNHTPHTTHHTPHTTHHTPHTTHTTHLAVLQLKPHRDVPAPVSHPLVLCVALSPGDSALAAGCVHCVCPFCVAVAFVESSPAQKPRLEPAKHLLCCLLCLCWCLLLWWWCLCLLWCLFFRSSGRCPIRTRGT